MPVTPGSPPVTWPTIPGNESDGNGVSALLYSKPWCISPASTESGCVRTYQARSCWCRPSTEISSTCRTDPGELAEADAEARAGEASSATAAASAARCRNGIKRMCPPGQVYVRPPGVELSDENQSPATGDRRGGEQPAIVCGRAPRRSATAREHELASMNKPRGEGRRGGTRDRVPKSTCRALENRDITCLGPREPRRAG
jgi:hypothetical protein